MLSLIHVLPADIAAWSLVTTRTMIDSMIFYAGAHLHKIRAFSRLLERMDSWVWMNGKIWKWLVYVSLMTLWLIDHVEDSGNVIDSTFSPLSPTIGP